MCFEMGQGCILTRNVFGLGTLKRTLQQENLVNDVVQGTNEQICMLALISQRLPPQKKNLELFFFNSSGNRICQHSRKSQGC